ncbi:hypothetical protein [Actinomyces polynesiensis]|uniref:hypothetical protein n=1 Tax=Actinomyces polynesiensis TaxID=1325934 RepID=UPI0012E0BF6F|nr:hypothetical protein [Actinomyces polynesiensis]
MTERYRWSDGVFQQGKALLWHLRGTFTQAPDQLRVGRRSHSDGAATDIRA